MANRLNAIKISTDLNAPIQNNKISREVKMATIFRGDLRSYIKDLIEKELGSIDEKDSSKEDLIKKTDRQEKMIHDCTKLVENTKDTSEG